MTERNCLSHRFNKDKKIAGKKRYYAFMKRHPELSLRQPESTLKLEPEVLVNQEYQSSLTFWRNWRTRMN
jgi:hypothetical protein